MKRTSKDKQMDIASSSTPLAAGGEIFRMGMIAPFSEQIHEPPKGCKKCAGPLGFSGKCLKGCDDKQPFEEGINVFVASQGVAKIEKIGPGDGFVGECYHLRFLNGGSTRTVQVGAADRAGLRRLLDPEGIRKALEHAVESAGGIRSGNPRIRSERNAARLKTGDAEDLAELLREVSDLKHRGQGSIAENEMFRKAMLAFADEVSVVLGISLPEARKHIESKLGIR